MKIDKIMHRFSTNRPRVRTQIAHIKGKKTCQNVLRDGRMAPVGYARDEI